MGLSTWGLTTKGLPIRTTHRSIRCKIPTVFQSHMSKSSDDAVGCLQSKKKTVFEFLQELSNSLDNVTQERGDLVNKVSSLEESISSADQERKILEDKMNALTEEKDEVEKKLASVTESLETEKQVCCFRNLSVVSLTLG